MPCASEALGLSPVALLILTYLQVQTYLGSLRLPRLSPQTDSSHNFRAAPQTDLVTSACMLSSECSVPGRSACPIYLWFYVGALKAAFVSSFSGITHFITYISAACAFITRDQPLSSPRQLSAQARSHSQIQGTSTTYNYLSSAGGRSRLPFEDVLIHEFLALLMDFRFKVSVTVMGASRFRVGYSTLQECART